MPKPVESIIEARPLDAHNRQLVANVHPPNWTNPQPRGRYHMVVIGAGAAGLVTASGAAGLGARVALIERNLMGGDCLNSGCVPSKALIRAAHAAAAVRDAGEFGVRLVANAATLDFDKLMERMRRLRADISTHDAAERFSRLGVDVYLGDAVFTGRRTVRVGETELKFAKACIATGTRPVLPPVPGLSEANPLTNETVFSLEALPRRLAVIGGGPVGVELAQAFARFGSGVTLLERTGGILPREDRDAAAIVERSLQRDGVTTHFRTRAVSVAASGDDTLIRVAQAGRSEVRDIAADRVLVAAGRLPNVDSLGLDAAGIECDSQRGVLVNDRLRTSNRHVYAAGDVCSAYRFTHMADAMARIVIGNALFFGRSRASALKVPWCTYSDPGLAHVGLNETQARQAGMRVDTYRTEMASVDRALLDGEAEGFVKIHCKRGTDAILGATIVARHAGDMLAELTLAMSAGLGLKAIASTIHAYPTRSEAVRKAADAYQRSRLTPGLKRLLQGILHLQR